MCANVLLIEALGGGWQSSDLPAVGWEPPILAPGTRKSPPLPPRPGCLTELN